MTQKQAYEKKLQSKFDEWQAKIDQLKAKAEQAEAEVQLEMYKQIEELRIKQEHAKDKMLSLQSAGENAWQELKTGVEKAWDDLGDAVQSAYSKFNKD